MVRLLQFIIAVTMIVILVLVVRTVLFTGPVLYPHPLPQHQLIDAHIHVAGLGYGSDSFISDELKKNLKFKAYLNAFDIDERTLQQQGDQIVIANVAKLVDQSQHVDGAVILALDGVIDDNGNLDRTTTQAYIPNDFIAEQTKQYPNLYFGASINPYRHDAIERLQQAKADGAVLIKWLPNIQHIDPADKRLVAFYQTMKALALPLLTHTGQEKAFDSALDQFGDPTKLKLPLSLGVTVIAAHIATTGFNEDQANDQRILPMFDQYPNLYADISSLTQINKLGYLNKALTHQKLKDRLIYASNYPLINTPLVSPYYFPFNLSIDKMRRIAAINNPLDRDVALKQALGMRPATFSRSAQLLNIRD